MQLLKIVLCLILILTLSSCVTNYPFSLAPFNNTFEANEKSKSVVLNIEMFEDVRADFDVNNLHFKEKRKTPVNDLMMCINAEKNYVRPLSETLTKVTAAYIKRTLLFKNVMLDKKDLADYNITAKLKSFKSSQYFSFQAHRRAMNRAVLFGSFGIIGGVINATTTRSYKSTTEGEVLLELDEVKIYNRENELIADIGLIDYQIQGEFEADIECWCAFWNAEDAYPKLVEKLLDEILIAVRTDLDK